MNVSGGNGRPAPEGSGLRLRVNPIACAAFGFCAEYAPELFALDEWGYAWPQRTDVPQALAELAREAARLCPKRAIVLAATGRDAEAGRHS